MNLSAVRFAQDVVTRKMLANIKEMLARYVTVDEFVNVHITTEINQEILAWIYTSHEKNMNMALGALEALEIADGTGCYIYTIINVKNIMQLIFVEDDNATDIHQILCLQKRTSSSITTLFPCWQEIAIEQCRSLASKRFGHER